MLEIIIYVCLLVWVAERLFALWIQGNDDTCEYCDGAGCYQCQWKGYR